MSYYTQCHTILCTRLYDSLGPSIHGRRHHRSWWRRPYRYGVPYPGAPYPVAAPHGYIGRGEAA